MKILLIIPYFGTLPVYTPAFFHSCKYLKKGEIDILFITDDKKIDSINIPDNVTVRITTFYEMQIAVKKICDANLYSGYKLCDYKPLYGTIFKEDIKDYEYWGYCDIDVMLGDIPGWLRKVNYKDYERVGKHGRLFTMYKFRSMTVAGEGKTSIASAEPARITPLGAKLRKYKLDELPELWNVLIGNMSFVGPRPDVPGYADLLQGKDRKVLLLRPGITGPASLKYRDEEDLLSKKSNPQKYNDDVIFPDKVRINIYYLDHYSFINDIKMIICTVLGKRMKYNNEII